MTAAPGLTPRTIAIIGGGPCGLTLARLLQVKGISDYVVFERDAAPPSSAASPNATRLRAGGSLDLHPDSGQRALREAGLHGQFAAMARWGAATVLRIAGKDGAVVFETGDDRDLPEIDRVDLRQILLDSIPAEKIRWGCKAAGAEMAEDGPVVTFEDGQVVKGVGLVVGCDGLWSKIRPLIHPVEPDYSGRTIIESRVAPSHPVYAKVAARTGEGFLMCLQDGKGIMAMRQGDASYRLYVNLEVPETYLDDGAVDLADAEATSTLLTTSPDFYADWADELKAFIRAGTDCYPWRLYSLPVDSLAWEPASVPGVTVAGDAAHVTMPYAGEGVNCSMADALVLAEKIAEYGTEREGLQRAVREYEADMQVRAKGLITRTERNGELLFDRQGAPHTFVKMVQSTSQSKK